MPVVVHVRQGLTEVMCSKSRPSASSRNEEKLGERSGKSKREPLEVGMTGSGNGPAEAQA